MKDNNEKIKFSVFEKLRTISSKFFNSQTKVMIVSGLLGILLFITATILSISTGYYNLDTSLPNNENSLSLTEDISFTAGNNYNTTSQVSENNNIKETEIDNSLIQENEYSSEISSSNDSSMINNIQSIPEINSQDTQDNKFNKNNTISNNNSEVYTSKPESVSTQSSSNLNSETSSDILEQSNIINQSSIVPENSSDPTENIKININTATYDELVDALPISDVVCERIIEYRQLNGPFESIDELLNIEGIGKGMLESIKEMIII